MLAVGLAFFFVAAPTFTGLCLALLKGCATFRRFLDITFIILSSTTGKHYYLYFLVSLTMYFV